MSIEEEFILSGDDEENDVMRVVPLASALEPGTVAGVQPSGSTEWRVDDGVVKVGNAHEGKPGAVDGIWDTWGRHAANNGELPLPPVPRAVRTTSGNVVKLEELDGGAWQAAEVARCTLPSGETLSLRVHVENNYVLNFELTLGAAYY